MTTTIKALVIALLLNACCAAQKPATTYRPDYSSACYTKAFEVCAPYGLRHQQGQALATENVVVLYAWCMREAACNDGPFIHFKTICEGNGACATSSRFDMFLADYTFHVHS